jgi:hypothetical protein
MKGPNREEEVGRRNWFLTNGLHKIDIITRYLSTHLHIGRVGQGKLPQTSSTNLGFDSLPHVVKEGRMRGGKPAQATLRLVQLDYPAKRQACQLENDRLGRSRCSPCCS